MNAPDELFATSEPFLAQNSKFAMGVGYDETAQMLEPPPFPNQAVYASSMGADDQYFYKKFKEASIMMDAGDRRYFCCDLDCDAVIKATRHGIALTEPLLNRETVDSAMRKNKELALREYYNIPTSGENGDGQLIKRSEIIRISKPYAPTLVNKDHSKFIIAWDPARQMDNSTVTICRVYKNQFGWNMRFENVITLADRMSKKHKMMNAPNQVKEFKQILLDYNGPDAADYENILAIMVDSGSGGAGIPLTDYLTEDWTADDGTVHRGLIDSEFNEDDNKKFPNAIDGLLHLISPTKYRSTMFEELRQLVDLNVVQFPEEYSNREYINLIYQIDKDGKEQQIYSYPTEKQEKDFKKKGLVIETRPYNLSMDEEAALIQIDMMKTEIVNVVRYKTTTAQDRFELSPEKKNRLHDDRCYTAILCAHYLAQLRRENITKKRNNPAVQEEILDLPMRRGTRDRAIG